MLLDVATGKEVKITSSSNGFQFINLFTGEVYDD